MVIVVIVETAVIPAGSHQRAALMYSAISCVYICICNCICICICTVQWDHSYMIFVKLFTLAHFGVIIFYPKARTSRLITFCDKSA